MQQIKVTEKASEVSEHKRIITEAYQRGYKAGSLVGGFTVGVFVILLIVFLF